VQNPELRQKLKPFAWGMAATLDTASHIVVILAKKNARYDSPFMLDGIKRRGITDPEAIGKTLAKYQNFQADDAHLLDNERTLFDWCSKQTYIALANMMTGAALIGIDSCPIEGFNYDEMNRVLAEAGAFDPAEWGELPQHADELIWRAQPYVWCEDPNMPRVTHEYEDQCDRAAVPTTYAYIV